MKNLNFMPLIILLFAVLACGQSKTEETKSGRLSYIETLKYGAVGTHGSQGWYVADREFKVAGRRWKPAGIDVNEHIANCEKSPNEAVEALKCYSFADSKELVYVLRMTADKPVWITVSDAAYRSGNNLGEWIGDGHWLLFKDFYFNVETSERREIKNLPDDPGKYLIAASPDLGTIMYEENCSMGMYDPQTRERIPNKLLDERCEKYYDGGIYDGVAAYWLIDAKTGEVKILELKEDKYPSLKRGIDIPAGSRESNLKKMIVWEKDKDGKDRLVAPN